MGSLHACVLPGVKPILDGAIARGTVGQGLLTGNLRQGAATKLGYHDLWDYFPFGAFADDSERRDELGPHALRRARERYGVDFPPGSVWVIGDTPHDIACARPIGANSLAVATGTHSAAELALHRPTALLENLGDSDAFWRIVGG
jgi:phosphoglycolate phosphatase-like HAD superfamily hydrolase